MVMTCFTPPRPLGAVSSSSWAITQSSTTPPTAVTKATTGNSGFAATTSTRASNRRRGGQRMVVEYIRYTIGADRAEEFDEAYQRAARSLDASEHCERYEVSRCTEDPAHQIVRIEWDCEEGHLGGFRQSTEFRSFLDAVGPFVHDIEEMRHYQVTLTSKG